MLLIGYAITLAVYLSLLLMVAFAVIERRGIAKLLRERVDRYSLLALAAMLIFFVVFSSLYVSPVEQLYFDENIYQGVALNILHSGNALWCQYGTGYLTSCYANVVYHDPVGWSAFIAVAFAIFGAGRNTAYGLQLLAGTLSILLVFLLASMMVKRRGFAIIATLAFLVMPQLYIWARTQADVDLPFMMLATLSFFLFMIFIKRRNLNSLAMFAFSLDLVSYMRIEAILLVPIFAVLLMLLSDQGVAATLRERIRVLKKTIDRNTRALLVFLVFVVLMFPAVYYVAFEAQNPSYGQVSGQSVLSLDNFKSNILVNVPFLLGQINGVYEYPIAFHYLITPLAIAGAIFLALDKGVRNRFGVLLALLLWFFAYFLFYTAFYAGSASFGVDSRFMLQLLPPLVLLASFAIVGVGRIAEAAWVKVSARKRGGVLALRLAAALASAGLLVYPFVALLPAVTIAPSAMPQQSVILRAINFFYGNYTAVPQNCLVFSHTPDIWFEVNRSATQIGNLAGANSTLEGSFSSYSCLVLDYGYWCVVPPYHGNLCSYLTSRYKVAPLATSEPQASGYSTAFYRILNYT